MALSNRIASIDQIADALPVSREMLERIGVLSSQVARKVAIEQVTVGEGTLKDVHVDKLQLGSASIKTIEVLNTSAQLKQSSAQLNKVRGILELGFSLDWKVDLGWIGSWDGSDDLGSIDIPIPEENLTIPDLDNVKLDIPKVSIPSAVAKMEPVTQLPLGDFKLSKAQLNGLVLPSSGLSVSGMGVGDLSLSSVNLPGVNASSLSLKEGAPTANITLPGASLSNLKVPDVGLPTITSGSISTAAHASTRSITTNLGILKVTLSVSPVVHLDIGSMSISDAKLAATIGELSLDEISLPVTLEGLNASGVDLDDIKVDKITF